ESSLIASLVLISFIVCLFMAWFFSHKARHRERMLMIEKGIDDKMTEHPNKGKSVILKIGIIIIGLSIGLVIISILDSIQVLSGDIIPLAILGFCGGISLLISNNVGSK